MNIAYIVDETSFFLPNILKEIIDVRNDNSNLIYIIKKIPKKACMKSYLIRNFYQLNLFELSKLTSLFLIYFFKKVIKLSAITDNFYSVEELCKNRKLNYINVYHDINSQIYQKKLQNFNPDIIINMGSFILNDFILNLPKFGCINRHTSLLPSYKGLMPVFFALKNNEEFVGISFIKMNSKIDDGKILSQKKFHIKKKDTVFSLYKKTAMENCNLCNIAINELLNKRFIIGKSKESYFSWPNKNDWKIFRLQKKRFI